LICGDCGERDATIHYTEMVDGALSKWQLCDECARARGVGTGLASIAGPLVNILMGLLEEAGATDAGRDETGPVCPQCGLSFADFRTTGRLGCGVCYESFAGELKPLLRRVHGSTEHVGKYPAELSDALASRTELRRLRTDLTSAVRREDYEKAAELRDLIRARERGNAGAIRAAETSDVDV
jgi:protein arginine kinase activator